MLDNPELLKASTELAKYITLNSVQAIRDKIGQ